MSFKIEGLYELQNKLRNLASRAEKLHGKHNVRLQDLLSTEFIRRFTDFVTLDEMFEAFGKNPKSSEEFEAMSKSPEWNAFIEDRTLFASWQEMIEKAGVEWASEKLGFGN